MKKTLIISIEGNIGSGKSTVMKFLSENLNNYLLSNMIDLKICYLQEPVDIWNTIIDNDGKNIIQKYYEDQNKYAFSFQMMAYISRLSQIKNELTKNYDVIITERSLYTDKNVFAKMLYDDKKINEIDYKIYNKWFDEFTDILTNMNILYIKTNPEICSQRIIKRSRKGENIELKYLESCNLYHNNWIDNTSTDKIIIDGNNNINDSIVQDNKYLNNILNSIHMLIVKTM